MAQAPLVQHFDLIAQAPGGVARLRELILTLAVQGKLVQQDPSDEPASVLLQKIRAAKDRLIAEKKIRKGKPLPEIGDEEMFFELPETWTWVRLNSIGDWGAGATPSRTNSSYYGGAIPWFKSGELTADHITVSEETVTEAALRECSLRLNQPGDVLIAMYGATIGKTAILDVVGTTNQAVCACTPFLGMSNSYLLMLMKAYKPYFISQGAGGAQPNISREKIIHTVIGLPPLAEQSRIVTRVEELMQLCDALEASGQLEAQQHAQLVGTLLGTLTQSETPEALTDNWQRIATHFDLLLDRPEAVDALEQTILQLAVRGLLVPQDPSDEPASVLLQKIRAEKDNLIAQGKIKRDKPLAEIADEEKPFELPQGWEWVRLSALAAFENGDRGRNYPSRSNFVEQGIAFINAGHLVNERIDYSDMNYITPQNFDLLRSGKIERGDILYCLRGSLGKFAQVTNDVVGAIASSLVIVRLTDQAIASYVMLYLKSPLAANLIKRFDNGTAQPNLGAGDLAKFAVPLPPLVEQSHIITRVNELRGLCADLREKLEEQQSKSSNLAEALIEGG